MIYTNFFDGMEPTTADMTFTSLTAIGAQFKNRTNDFFSFGVVTGLTVCQDIAAPTKVIVTAGNAYDPTGERVSVASTLRNIGYGSGGITDADGSYTVVARYKEVADGLFGVAADGSTNLLHFNDGYTINVLKTGTDPGTANDIRLSGIVVTAPGATFIFDSNIRDSAANRLATGTGSGSGSSTPSAHASSHLPAGSDPINYPVTVYTAAGGPTLGYSNHFVVINKTSSSATTVTLPAAPTAGTKFIVKDGKGDASGYPITLVPASGTIDGSTSFIMNINRQSATVFFNGTEYSII